MKWTVVYATIIIFISFLMINRNTNNVCKTFDDYYTNRDNNENCYYNPEHELGVPQIIERQGYSVETHYVTTEDGYILTLFRIPNGNNNNGIETNTTKRPVLLEHGIALNGGTFVTTGNKSLGFILANAGYDVWLGNFRGSAYSRKHVHLNESDTKFWNFTFHELGIYDIPAQINYINSVVKQKVIYIGISMGTTAAFVYGTVYPEVADEKVEVFISLAPAVFSKNLWIPYYLGYLWNVVKYPLEGLTNGRLFPRPPFLPEPMFKLFCFPYPFQMEFCQITDMILLGWNYEQNDPETLPVTLQYNRDATSVKMLTHYFQLAASGQFLHFDYGTDTNKILYGQTEPPAYDLSKIKAPHYLIVALNDPVSTIENVELLYNVLPDRATSFHGIFVVKDKKFTHMDFLVGKDAVPLVYEPILKFLDRNMLQ